MTICRMPPLGLLAVALSGIPVGCASETESDGDPIDDPQGDGGGSSADSDDSRPRLGASDELDTCYWITHSDTATTEFTVNCLFNNRPIVGSCSGSTNLTDSHPYENNDHSNLPENNESWYALAETAGWRCAYDAATNGRVDALCCGASS